MAWVVFERRADARGVARRMLASDKHCTLEQARDTYGDCVVIMQCVAYTLTLW